MGQNGYCNFLSWCPLGIYNSLCLLILAKIVQCRIRFSNLPGKIYSFLISSFDKEGNSEVRAFLFAQTSERQLLLRPEQNDLLLAIINATGSYKREDSKVGKE